jgi:sterol 3beta-glucosyltransferase
MYVTERHLCFYAYLPKKSNSVIKSGFLSKRGKQNPRYNRYWFALKGDVLSYFLDSANLYFPSGHIDLRYGISAHLVETKSKDTAVKDFVVTTDNRTYQFRADSAPSAKEWVKAIQKVIFRSHNDGDSVKISLPIENVIDIEETSMLDLAETCKIRVVESDDSYAIDEVWPVF